MSSLFKEFTLENLCGSQPLQHNGAGNYLGHFDYIYMYCGDKQRRDTVWVTSTI